MKYLFSSCCHNQQIVNETVGHTAWCATPNVNKTYTKEFDTEKELHEYVHEKYQQKIRKLLRE